MSAPDTREIYLLGAGAHAREVLATLRALGRGQRIAGLLEEAAYFSPRTSSTGHPVYSEGTLDEKRAADVWLLGAIGSPARRKWIRRLEERNFQFTTAVHPSVITLDQVAIDRGAYVAAGSVLTATVRIGPHAVINVGCTINHDCDIAAFATLAPGVNLAGAVAVGEGAYVGIGATVVENVHIGEGAVVAGGACVTRDVPAQVLVAGVPARIIRRLAPGETVRFRPSRG